VEIEVHKLRSWFEQSHQEELFTRWYCSANRHTKLAGINYLRLSVPFYLEPQMTVIVFSNLGNFYSIRLFSSHI